jgi:hypothetical protein
MAFNGRTAKTIEEMVGVTGLEPATSRSRTVRSTSLSYTPLFMSIGMAGRSDRLSALNTPSRNCNQAAPEQASEPVSLVPCRGALLGDAAHRSDGGPIIRRTENSGAGHQDLGASRGDSGCVLDLDAAVHLDQT